MSQEDPDIKAVEAANLGFYDAFGGLDISEMAKVWDNSDQSLCIHPGGRLLVGWAQVGKSWEDIFYNTTLMHFNITGTKVVVNGDSAWVSCIENITTVVDGRAGNFAVQATNIFRRVGGSWLMVHHHGSG